MSIAGIGTDLADIARIAALLARFPERFPRRILAPPEYTDWCGRGRSAAWLAKRFAAKEALSKALGTGIGAKVAFHDLIISSNAQGAPEACFQAGALACAQAQGVTAIHLSLSDEGGMALAFAVLERKPVQR